MKSLAVVILVLVASVRPHSATAEDFATRVLRATCKIVHKDSTATGFLVEPPKVDPDKRVAVLVTANHVLHQMRSETAVLALRKRQKDGGYARHEVTIAVRSGEKPLWTKHPTHDVAALHVTLPNDVTARPLPFACLASEETVRVAGIHIGQPMLAFSFPVRFEANAAGFPIARKLVLASHPLAPVKTHPVFLADMHTFPGDSGGPVFLLVAGVLGLQGDHPS